MPCKTAVAASRERGTIPAWGLEGLRYRVSNVAKECDPTGSNSMRSCGKYCLTLSEGVGHNLALPCLSAPDRLRTRFRPYVEARGSQAALSLQKLLHRPWDLHELGQENQYRVCMKWGAGMDNLTTDDQGLQESFGQLGFVTCSSNVTSMLRRARNAASASDVTVLLYGETGSGKQVLAQGIHQLDEKRSPHSFVTVHCSTISEALAESELFGHQRGAFSGALTNRKGLFQAAQHGTIFLDDVNDLPLPLQPKLLDVIQRRTVRPVGSDREVLVDVRIIAACNQPLEPLVQQGRFRADLYHRLNVVKLSLPPLRDRGSDLAILILAMARRHSHLYAYGSIDKVDTKLLEYLMQEPFPGNVRELENTVQRMLFSKTTGMTLSLDDWTAQTAQSEVSEVSQDLLAAAAGALWKVIAQRGVPYARAFQEVEKRILETALTADGSTRQQIARRLQTSERTLYYKMRAHRLRSRAA